MLVDITYAIQVLFSETDRVKVRYISILQHDAMVAKRGESNVIGICYCLIIA